MATLKSKALEPENIEKQNLQVRQNLAQFKSDAPGGDILLQQMRTQMVKLHTTGQRWYVSYYTKLPSGKQVRNRAYGYINQEKDLEKRMQLLLELQNKIFYSLQSETDNSSKPVNQSINIYKCTVQMISDKEPYLKKTAHTSIKNKLMLWKKWLIESNISGKHPSDITKIDILNFRNWLMLKNLSNRSINNIMDEVSALFRYLKNNFEKLVYRNPCKNVDNLPSRSETHVAYTNEQAENIALYLRETDPNTLFYIKLVAYSFLRTKEARTLKIGDIDLKQWRIMLTAGNNKNSRRVWKMIPEIYRADFIERKISECPSDWYLFSKNGLPGPENIGETFFTKRYRKVKKHFNLSKLHTIYGFRHTFVSQLIVSGQPWFDVMKVTGHTSMSGFEKYVRSIMATPAKDLSAGFTVKL